jgi:hypothetical protein
VGNTIPNRAPQLNRARSIRSWLATLELFAGAGPISKQQMREDLGGSIVCRARPRPENSGRSCASRGWTTSPRRVRSGRAFTAGRRSGARGIGLSVGEAVGAALKYLVGVAPPTSRKWKHSSSILSAPGQGSNQRTAGGARTGFHSGWQPLFDPTGATQGPGDEQEPCGDGRTCPFDKSVPQGQAAY